MSTPALWLALPVILPLLGAALATILADRHKPLFTAAICFCLLGYGGIAVHTSTNDQIEVLRLGHWPAQIGIVLVLDRLAALMLMLTALLGTVGLWRSTQERVAPGSHFHALWLLQLAGLNGAFLTGDVFNLFVCFELLLAASYGLLLHGGGARRIRLGMHYVVLNLVGSVLFLVAVAVLYGHLGTLNFADLAVRIGHLPASEQAAITAATLLLLVVFLFKAAILPLMFWLPRTYATLSAPVAVLFAVLTKVGIYGILRTHGLLWSADHPGPELLHGLGIATVLVAAIGMLGTRQLKTSAGFATIGSSGMLVLVIGHPDPASLSAAVFYLTHTVLAVALLMLVAHAVRGGPSESRSESDAQFESESELQPGSGAVAARVVHAPAGTALLYLVSAMVVVGLPPFSGFLAKILVMHSLPAGWGWWTVLLGSLLMLIGAARTGIHRFWRRPPHPRGSTTLLAPACLMFALLLALMFSAAQVERHAQATAHQLQDRAGYVEAVLRPVAVKPALQAGGIRHD